MARNLGSSERGESMSLLRLCNAYLVSSHPRLRAIIATRRKEEEGPKQTSPTPPLVPFTSPSSSSFFSTPHFPSSSSSSSSLHLLSFHRGGVEENLPPPHLTHVLMLPSLGSTFFKAGSSEGGSEVVADAAPNLALISRGDWGGEK